MFFFRREIRSFKQFGRVTYKEDDAGLHLSAKIARMLNNITRGGWTWFTFIRVIILISLDSFNQAPSWNSSSVQDALLDIVCFGIYNDNHREQRWHHTDEIVM